MSPLFLLSLSVFLPFPVSGYKIDGSCEDKGIATDIRNAMISAFEMVNAAHTTLTKPSLSTDELELLGNLFAKEGEDPAQLVRDGRLDKTIRILNDILTHMEREVTDSNAMTFMDVIIFCHYDRWVPIGGKENLWKDTTNEVVLSFREQQCRGGKTIDKVALAVTANPVRVVDLKTSVKSTRQPTQIQLCLWFVDWIKQKEHKTASDVKWRTKIGKKIIEKAESNGLTWGLGLNQIDAFSLLDKVLLHEMIHARGAFIEYEGDGEVIEGLIDVSSPNRLLSYWNWAAYGWKGAIKLARKGENLGGRNAADNNADTIALFGSGCKLLQDPKPCRIDSKGRIVPK